MNSRFLALLVGALIATSVACAEPRRSIAGSAYVIDGDTLVISGWRVRLKGVDAPELGTTSGERARDVMSVIIGAHSTVFCWLTGETTWGREVGFCLRNDGLDVNREIIARGVALACARYSNRYVHDETAEAQRTLTRALYCLHK